MDLKFTLDGPLAEIVKRAFPEAPGDAIEDDYEDTYEWVWLTLADLGMTLNISREHDRGANAHVFPIYVNAWSLDRQTERADMPRAIAERFARAHACAVEIHHRPLSIERPDGEPDEIIDGTHSAADR